MCRHRRGWRICVGVSLYNAGRGNQTSSAQLHVVKIEEMITYSNQPMLNEATFKTYRTLEHCVNNVHVLAPGGKRPKRFLAFSASWRYLGVSGLRIHDCLGERGGIDMNVGRMRNIYIPPPGLTAVGLEVRSALQTGNVCGSDLWKPNLYGTARIFSNRMGLYAWYVPVKHLRYFFCPRMIPIWAGLLPLFHGGRQQLQ